VRQVVATIDGRLRQAGDRYTVDNQAPRPAAVASEMGHKLPFRRGAVGRRVLVEKTANRQCKLYSGFSLFGVPYNEIDVRYAAEQLFDIYSNKGKGCTR
jgi:hypothetical protein